MLNGLEKTLERKLPLAERRWVVRDPSEPYDGNTEFPDSGWRIPLKPAKRRTWELSGFRFQKMQASSESEIFSYAYYLRRNSDVTVIITEH